MVVKAFGAPSFARSSRFDLFLSWRQEAYLDLAKKTLAFFSTATRLYDADYIIKVDDDVFLRLDRVPAVLRQWADLGAGACSEANRALNPAAMSVRSTLNVFAWGYSSRKRCRSLATSGRVAAMPNDMLLRADYVGCMKTGGALCKSASTSSLAKCSTFGLKLCCHPSVGSLESFHQGAVSVCAAIMTDPKYRWYEPQHVLLGSKTYFAHTWGSIYVLSGAIATFLASVPPEALRYFSNEGRSIWMPSIYAGWPTQGEHRMVRIHRCGCAHLQRHA